MRRLIAELCRFNLFIFLGEGFQLARALTGDVDFTNLGRTGGTRWPKPGDE
jgi:hypothetical protein